MQEELKPQTETQPPQTTAPAEPASGEVATADALAALRQQFEEARAQADDWLDKYRRTAADFSNYRKRQERDAEQQQLELRKRVLSRFLPVAEDFRRALLHVPADAAETQWVKGMALIAQKIETMLDEFQVQPMEAEGRPFDPAYHEALLREPSDKYPAETVIEEMEKGYLIGNQVLKAALVKVSSGPPDPAANHKAQ